MDCPNCKLPMQESYDAQTGGNRMFECSNCDFQQNAFDAFASNEGYPSDPDEFEDWRRERGL